MTLARLLTAGALALALAACAPADKGAAAADPAAKTIATVNGKKITEGMLDVFTKAAAGRPASDLDPESRKEAIDALIDMQVLAAEAQKQGLDKKGEAAASIELARMNVLQRSLSDAYLKDKNPTDQELRAEYDALVSKMPRSEYRARHILLQNEQFANEVLARLKAGERFETLARQSLDPSSKDGGDLGWSPPNRYVAPFADALVKLKKGETTAAPVRSQFGWHIIRLDDVRDTPPPPPFEQVKQQIEPAVRAKKLEAYTDELVKAAKIERVETAATDAAKAAGKDAATDAAKAAAKEAPKG
jgi:peptidyl-prolyl cis-trans isomerase C